MDNATPRRVEPPLVAEYFYRSEGEPELLELITALEGVCKSMEHMAYTMSTDDHDDVERLGDLGVAASILAKQLRHRYNIGYKPSKRRKPRPRLEVVA